MKRWEVVRIGYRLEEAEVLGRHRFHWTAWLHHKLTNYGLMISVLRDTRS